MFVAGIREGMTQPEPSAADTPPEQRELIEERERHDRAEHGEPQPDDGAEADQRTNEREET